MTEGATPDDATGALEREGITGIWLAPGLDAEDQTRVPVISIETVGGPKRFMRVPLRVNEFGQYETVTVEWGWTLAEDAVRIWPPALKSRPRPGEDVAEMAGHGVGSPVASG